MNLMRFIFDRYERDIIHTKAPRTQKEKGVRKNKETPRDFYADDQVRAAVYSQASEELRDAMDLNY